MTSCRNSELPQQRAPQWSTAPACLYRASLLEGSYRKPLRLGRTRAFTGSGRCTRPVGAWEALRWRHDEGDSSQSWAALERRAPQAERRFAVRIRGGGRTLRTDST